ncbi:hypothetical protein CDL12_13929 [Handroanthus impetiginosus]|uniref:Uncharacterized protein n=1 Tax=Handroanthus impetiginosus TaxID=429701 RepID=A0A2G9H7J4_9LAMI|nr:hypothetical protein CDL12_13929 [Handroanthus impetiginosus]
MGDGAWPFLVGGAICLIIAIVGLQRGIPSKCESSARVDYVFALCTHHPSLLPIEWSGEVFGSRQCGGFADRNVARSSLNLIVAGHEHILEHSGKSTWGTTSRHDPSPSVQARAHVVQANES